MNRINMMKYKTLLPGLNFEVGASGELLEKLSAAAPHPLPHDYLEFLRLSDGAGGFANEDDYLILYDVKFIMETDFSSEHSLARTVSEELKFPIFVFGSDGKDLKYGFAWKDGNLSVVLIDFYESAEDCLDEVSTDFSTFLDVLAQKREATPEFA